MYAHGHCAVLLVLCLGVVHGPVQSEAVELCAKGTTFSSCLAARAGATFADTWHATTESPDPQRPTPQHTHTVCNHANWVHHAYCAEHCPLQLQVTTPEWLANVTLCLADNTFARGDDASHLYAKHPLLGKVLPVKAAGTTTLALSMCDAADVPTDLSGSIVIGQLGGCTAGAKQAVLKTLNASAGLILDTAMHSTEVQAQLRPMRGTQHSANSPPFVTMARSGGDYLLERILQDDLQVTGRIILDCDLNTEREEEVGDSCGAAEQSALNVHGCAGADVDEDKMCVLCPLPLRLTTEADEAAEVCLRNNYLLPRRQANLVTSLPLSERTYDIMYLQFVGSSDGCSVSHYAGAAGKIVVAPLTHSCFWYTAALRAQEAGVAALWSLVSDETEWHTPILNGPSSLIHIPVHTVDRASSIRLVETIKQGARVGQGWVLPGVELRELVEVFPERPLVTAAGAVVEEEEDDVPEFEWTPTVVACVVLLGLTFALIFAFLAGGKAQSKLSSLRSTFKAVRLGADPDPTAADKVELPTKTRRTISLGVASSILSITLIGTVGSLGFVLAVRAGRQSTDAASENGDRAVNELATGTEDGIVVLADKWRSMILESTTEAVAQFMGDPIGTVEALAFLCASHDNSWSSFASLEPPHIALAATSKWEVTVRTADNFFASVFHDRNSHTFTYHRSDDRTETDIHTASGPWVPYNSRDAYKDMTMEEIDAQRTYSAASIAGTNDGGLFPVARFSVDRDMGTTDLARIYRSWHPFRRAALSGADVFAETQHMQASSQVMWRLDPMNVALPSASLLRNPISVTSVVFNTTRHRVAVIDAARDIAELNHAIHSLVTDVPAAANTTILLVRDDGVIISASAGTDVIVARAYDTMWLPVTGQFNIWNTYSTEVNAFGHYAQTNSAAFTRDAGMPFGPEQVAVKYPLVEGDFDQALQHRACGRNVFHFAFETPAGYPPAALDGEHAFAHDSGVNGYVAEIRGDCVTRGNCVVTDPAPEEDGSDNSVVHLTSGDALYVYTNLTTQTPAVRATKVAHSDGTTAWQSSARLYNASTTQADGTETIVLAGAETRTVHTVLHPAVFDTPFAISLWFYVPEEGALAGATLFSDTNGNVLHADGSFILRAGLVTCNVTSFSSETLRAVRERRWNHIVATADMLSTETCGVYLNGEVHSVQAMANVAYVAARHAATQGSAYRIGGEGFVGYVDELAAFNRSVTPDDVSTLYANSKRSHSADAAALLTEEVPSRQWSFSAKRVAIRGVPDLVFTTAVLVPKDDVLSDVWDQRNKTTSVLSRRKQNSERRFGQELGMAGLIVSLVAAFCVFLFIVFNATLTRPVGKLAHLLVQIAAMKLPEPGASSSFIGELEIMHQAIALVVGNLREYKAYMPLSLHIEEDDESLHSQRRTRRPPLPPRPTGAGTRIAELTKLEDTRDDDAGLHTPCTDTLSPSSPAPLSSESALKDAVPPSPPLPPPISVNPLTEAAVHSAAAVLEVVPSEQCYYRAQKRADSVASGESASSLSSAGTTLSFSSQTPPNSTPGAPRRPHSRAHHRAGLALVRRKVTFCIVNLKGFHERMSRLSGPRVVSLHGSFLEAALQIFSATKGVAEAFSGDRFMASYNAVTFNANHKSYAATAAATIRQKSPALDVRVSCSVTSGEARVGNVGVSAMKRFSYFSPVLTWGYALERYANYIDAAVLVDSWVAHDTQAQFAYRITTDIRFAKRDRRRPIRVAELLRPLPSAGRMDVFEQRSMLGQSGGELFGEDSHLKWNLWVSSVLDGTWDVAECAYEEVADEDKKGEIYANMLQAMHKRTFSAQQMYFH